MTAYLLDTSVLSAFAPDRMPPSARSAAWLARAGDSLYLSAITIAEIEQGIAKLKARDGGSKRATILSDWLATTLTQFDDRLISLDAALALATGRMSAHASAIGRYPGFPDMAIAATAKARGLTLLTRNIRHFEPLGIDVADPFEAPP